MWISVWSNIIKVLEKCVILAVFWFISAKDGLFSASGRIHYIKTSAYVLAGEGRFKHLLPLIIENL